MVAALVLLSSVYWLALAGLALRTFLALRTVASLPEPTRTTWPTVSIIIPARDEGAHILEALQAKLNDGYPALEVVLVDDRSTDDTGAQALGLNDPRLTVTRVDTLADGWLGKLNALREGLEVARGEWILFSDADVHLAPGTLSRVVAWAEAEGVDHVTALPKLLPAGPGISLALTAFFRFIVTFPRLWAVERPKSKAAAGVGAFNLVRTSALEASGGLEPLRMEIGDDMALGVQLKRAGARQRVLVAQEAVSLEFYPSLRVMTRALEKNGALAPVWLTVLGNTLLMGLELGYLAALSSADARVLALGLITWLVGAAAQCGICQRLRLPLWPAMFPGLGTVFISAAVCRSAVLAWHRGGVTWRGTFYPTAVIREHAPQALRHAGAHSRGTSTETLSGGKS